MQNRLGSESFEQKSAGKKAENLHALLQAGFPVPKGFVIFPNQDLSSLTDVEISAALEQIGGWPVAVRSSGTLEDLENASFAGQYQTFLNVSNIQEFRKRVQDCRDSGKNEHVQAYLKKNKLSSESQEVSVLVQKMIPAIYAGVAFSIHPLTGKEEHALIEVCHGLGEKLVSGHVTPSSYVLELHTGKTVSRELGGEKVELSPDQIQQLTQALLEIQAFFGRPQDVEWAFDEQGKLWILQSRPITHIQWRADIEEYTNADLKDGGVSARICTPLMFSLYRDATHHSMPHYFEKIRLRKKDARPETWMDYYYGRVYWNVSAVKRVLLNIPGFNEGTFDQDIGIQKDYGPSGPKKVPNQLKYILPAVPVALALEKAYKEQLHFVDQFGLEFEKQIQVWQGKMTKWQDRSDEDFFSDLKSILKDFHLWTETTYFTTVYNNSNAQTEFKGFIEKMDSSLGGETSIVSLLGGLSDVSHLEMQKDLLKLYQIARDSGFEHTQWNKQLDDFLIRHGFHSDAELDISVPRWTEVPKRIQEMVQQIIQSGIDPADPEKTSAEQKQQFEEELKQIENRLSQNLFARLKYRSGFLKHLNRVRAFLLKREQMREYSTRCYAIVRAAILEAGLRWKRLGRTKQSEDIFMLQVDEIIQYSQNQIEPSQVESLIAQRRAIYQGYRSLTPPNELGQGVLQRSEDSYIQDQTGNSLILKGLGCSSGVQEGLVRVVESLSEMHLIQRGDILVTRFTDPSWTPLLGLVSGIVTEVGGLLSHAAVIGREYGIPAVLNLPGATRILKTGQKARINGRTGVVEVLE